MGLTSAYAGLMGKPREVTVGVRPGYSSVLVLDSSRTPKGGGGGARDRILNTKVARRACGGRTPGKRSPKEGYNTAIRYNPFGPQKECKTLLHRSITAAMVTLHFVLCCRSDSGQPFNATVSNQPPVCNLILFTHHFPCSCPIPSHFPAMFSSVTHPLHHFSCQMWLFGSASSNSPNPPPPPHPARATARLQDS